MLVQKPCSGAVGGSCCCGGGSRGITTGGLWCWFVSCTTTGGKGGEVALRVGGVTSGEEEAGSLVGFMIWVLVARIAVLLLLLLGW